MIEELKLALDDMKHKVKQLKNEFFMTLVVNTNRRNLITLAAWPNYTSGLTSVVATRSDECQLCCNLMTIKFLFGRFCSCFLSSMNVLWQAIDSEGSSSLYDNIEPLWLVM